MAIGFGEASALLKLSGMQTADWNGQSVDSTSVLVRYTLAGDANLDGAVNFDDLVKLAQSYNTSVSTDPTGGWTRGDFNYDGVVDFNDLVKLAQNYNTAVPQALVPGASANFEADLARAFASVPEPGTLGGLVIATGTFPRRRHRRRI